MKNILVLMPVEARHKEKIEAAAKDCSVVYSTPGQVTEEQVRKANIIFGNPKAAMIGASENLEWLQLESAGTDAYIVPGVLDKKTVLTNATGAYTKAVSEHAFALTEKGNLRASRLLQRTGFQKTGERAFRTAGEREKRQYDLWEREIR